MKKIKLGELMNYQNGAFVTENFLYWACFQLIPNKNK